MAGCRVFNALRSSRVQPLELNLPCQKSLHPNSSVWKLTHHRIILGFTGRASSAEVDEVSSLSTCPFDKAANVSGKAANTTA
eukprot:936862-Alexandrium_andersonii.AAC.1